jgi:hypothetical protein
MNNRGAVFTGILLILIGGVFLLINLANWLFGAIGIEVDASGLWPLILVIAGVVFYLPFLLWWRERQSWIGLLVPGTLLLANGLLLLYQSMTGHWETWAYAWTIEPIAVGLSLFLMYLLGKQDRGLLIAAGIVGGIGLVMLVIFGSFMGGPLIRIAGPLLLIASGGIVLLASLLRPRT